MDSNLGRLGKRQSNKQLKKLAVLHTFLNIFMKMKSNIQIQKKTSKFFYYFL